MKIAAALFLLLPGFSWAQKIAIGEYALPNQTEPWDIVAGPDGAMWFTGFGVENSLIGRMPPSGLLTEWSIGYTAYEYTITSGPDGALWFTYGSTGEIGRITTAGAMTFYHVPTANAVTNGITVGPDGALWFTEALVNQIGRITTSGAITEYPIPTANGSPGPITTGSDGALWFGEYVNPYGDQIGRITTAGAVTMFPIPEGGLQPNGITSGPDGALWFADGNGVGRVTTAGVFKQYDVPVGTSFTQGITVGPDGALWFTEELNNKIGRITIEGKITEYAVPTANSLPIGIAEGFNGELWFTEYGTNKLGEIFFPSADLSVTPDSGYYRSSLSFTGSGYAPNETVVVYTTDVGSAALAIGTADATGAFTATALAPESAYGPRLFVAQGITSAKLGTASFSMAPRLILNPSSGAPGSSATATGYGFGAYEDVQLYWNTPRVLLNWGADQQGHITFTFTVPAKAPVGLNKLFGRGVTTLAIGPGSFTVE